MPICCKEIDEYISLCDNGILIISNDVRLLIDNIVKPLLIDEFVKFDADTYDKYLKYTSKYYYPSFHFQKFLAAFHFMYYDDDTLVFNEYLYMMGRGNGKDGFISPLCNFFQTEYFGVKNYHIDIVANDESQAEETFEVVYDMMTSPEYKNLMKKNFVVNKERIQNKKTKSKLKFNTANSKTKDGKRPGCVVFNEIHAYENYSNINVHTSGRGKVKYARTIYITTNGYVRGGPLDDYINLSEMKLRGELPKLRLFPFLCRLDTDHEANDFNTFEKANPSISYLPALRQEIKDVFDNLEYKPSTKVEFYVKRLNLIKEERDKCAATWENIMRCNVPIGDVKGKLCICGIDYAEIRDFASVIFEIPNEQYFDIDHHSWFNLNSDTANSIKYDIDSAVERGEITTVTTPTIDPDVIVDYIIDKTRLYEIYYIVMDTFRYSLFKNSFEKYGIYPRSRENQNGRLILVRSGTFTHSKVAPQIDVKFENGLYRWGNDRTMNWFVNNTGVKTHPNGNKEYFKINSETRKNDGFMGLVHCESMINELPNLIVDEDDESLL
ncbi:MAG: terminase TerL endonuclease subunit [Anaerorhabdus sp.]